MMRTVLLPAAMLAALTACAQGAPDTSADLATLEAEAPAWFDHYNRGDADAVINMYAEDAVVMPAGAPTATGHAAIRSYIVADLAESTAGGLTVRNGAVTGVGVSGDIGWVSGDYSVGGRSVIADDLFHPTGVLAGPDGSVYVENRGLFGSAGEVLRHQW